MEYFESHGFQTPLIVDCKDGLGLKVPHNDFSIADVERCVGMCVYISFTFARAECPFKFV